MARRYIGTAIIRLQVDDWGVYHGTIAVRGQHCFTFELRGPACTSHFNDLGFGIGIASDAPEAYDRMAQTAVAFGSDDGDDGNRADWASTIRSATEWATDSRGEYVVRRRPAELPRCRYEGHVRDNQDACHWCGVECTW